MAGKRILLATHQVAINEVVGNMLTSTGYEVKSTAHPSQIVAIVESFGPGLVLTELIMPEIDGFRLSQELSRRFPNLKIAFLDELEEKILRALLDRGISCDSLGPPFEQKNLLDMVSTWLSGADHIDPATWLRDSRQFRIALNKYVGSDFGKGWKNPSLIFIEFFECASSHTALESCSHFLRDLGALLAAHSDMDFAYRYGTRRFAILLASTPKNESLTSSQHLMPKLKSLLSHHNLADKYFPAICVLSVPDDARLTEQVMEVAGRLIVQAKKTQTGICAAGTVG